MILGLLFIYIFLVASYAFYDIWRNKKILKSLPKLMYLMKCGHMGDNFIYVSERTGLQWGCSECFSHGKGSTQSALIINSEYNVE
jgi:hypothetical protein